MTAKQGKVTKIKFEKKGTGITLRVIGVNSDMLDGKKSLPDPAVIDKTERAWLCLVQYIVLHMFKTPREK